MSGPVVFQMWIVLLLGTITEIGMAQVSTAKVMRSNIRRDGEMSSLFHFVIFGPLACLFGVYSVVKLK